VRIFLTGIAGFAGSHLAEALVSDGGFEVSGLLAPGEPARNLDAVADRLRLFAGDLLDRDAVTGALRESMPDVVVHLAAVAFVPSDSKLLQRVNVEGSGVLLDALRDTRPETKAIFISSSDVYDAQRLGDPAIDEDHRIAPTSAYAKSQRAMEERVAEYRERHGMDLVVLRPFNHIGPRQSPDFVVSSFARQSARIETGQQEPVLRVGNLDPRRDFTDVRDIARAYVLAVRHARGGDVFNLAAGRSRAIREVLEFLLERSSARIEVIQDPERTRPAEKPDIVGSARRFKERTGWTPAVPFHQSLDDTLAYWRRTV
jgi:GDP-4-dehydro-6-deoxy-D-mannose reductase